MIIQSIQVENLGPFRHLVKVGPMQKDLHILSDKNEQGKSTLIKAAVRCLFDKHTCKDSSIKDLQPAGSELAPKVTVCFSQNDKAFKIHKRFLNQPISQFYERQNNDWTLIADGDAADEKVFELLESEQPGRGATKPSHWGLMRYLWAMQGEPISWPDWQGETGEKVKSHLAKVQIDSSTDELARVAQEIAGQLYTATGKPRKGGLLKAELDSIDELKSELLDTQRQMEDLEAREVRFQSLQPNIQRLEKELAEAGIEARELRRNGAIAESVLFELKILEQNLKNAEKLLQEIQTEKQNLNQLQESLKDYEKLALEARNKSKKTVTSQQKHAAELDKVRTLKLSVQRQLKQIEQQLERTQSILELRNKQQRLESLSRLYSKAQDSDKAVQSFRKELKELPDMTPKKLSKLEEMERSIREKEVKLQATGLTIELNPDLTGEGSVELDGVKETLNYTRHSSKTLRATRTALLQLKDWGAISIRSGSEEISALVDSLDSERNSWNAALAEMEVKGIDSARDIIRKRDELKSRIREKESALKGMLEDWDDLESLRSETERISKSCQNLDSQLGLNDSEVVETVIELESTLVSQKVELKSKRAELVNIEDQINSQQDRLQTIISDSHASNNEVARIESEISAARQRINDINQRYKNGMDEAFSKAQLEFVKAEARLTEKKKDLPENYSTLPERNRRATAAEAEIRQELEKCRREVTLLEGELKASGASGLYSEETRLLEAIEQAESRIAELQTDGNAARLLSSLIDYRKNQATQTVLGPLEERLSQQFALLTGYDDRRVFLNDQLAITGIGRESATIPFDSLSQGAREQLVLSLRLAVAEELSNDGMVQCLILDDVLVNSDKERRERIMDVLSAAKEKFQILLLTCHPDWYRGLGSKVEIQKIIEDQ